MKEKTTTEASPYPTWFDETARTFEGKIWLRGHGKLPAKYLVIGERPGRHEMKEKKVFVGPANELMFNRMTMLGFEMTDAYFTNAVKYMIPANKSVTAKDLKSGRAMLEEEIRRVNPQVIVCLGANALKQVAGKDMNLNLVRGEFIAHPTLPGVQIFTLHNPAYLMRNAEAVPAFEKDIEKLVQHQRGELVAKDTVDYGCINTVSTLRAFKDWLFATYPRPLLVIDMEWNGKTWMDPQRFIRTVQIGYDWGKAVIIEVHDEQGKPLIDDEAGMWQVLKELLEDPRVDIAGHNVISDGEWLLSYGIDIRPRVVWDTMLAEYLLNETGPWDLGEVAVKYTNYGRYFLSVELWVKKNANLCRHGYGPVPRELLYPYGAIDVDAPRRAMEKQAPLIAERFMQRRGIQQQYPSLWDTTMRTQQLIYELEQTGMLVDKTRLEELINAYQGVRANLLGVITTEAATHGYVDFSPTSTDDVRKLLFNVLQLPPVKTTAGKAWTDAAGNQGMDNDTEQRASTDKTVLEILQDHDPIVKHILQFRRIDTACKTWLRHAEEDEDEASKGGGIPAKIWPDGRLHAHFSQLAETGRFRHSKPNVANWPKKAEGYMEEIFGKGKVPPQIRTIIVPPPGYVLMEGDFVQAELFVLAALSGDQSMMSALTTPGRDLHDLTAITAFRLQVLGPDGEVVPEQAIVDLAARCGAGSKEFKSFMKQLRYRDTKGRVMTRDEFKETIRVSAKNVNFGIPYGRGALDIARQVKAETGSKLTISQLEAELSEIVRAWKEETYPVAWKYMEACANSVYTPGYLVNPWGRYRRFARARFDEERDDLERQAQNYPIQSTVADNCMIAMDLMDQYRTQNGLHFRFQNQIHDAIMIEVPEAEIDACKRMYNETMGSIDIPVGPPFHTLRLGADVKVLTRWGVDAE